MDKVIMEMKVKDKHDEEIVIRKLLADKAFDLIWDIKNMVRGQLKHGDSKDSEKVLENIQDEINESCLMEFYN